MAFAMHGLEKRYEVISANLANVQTAGHKRLIARASLFGEELGKAKSATGDDAGGTLVRDFSQGDLVDTGNPMELALDGPGFFAVEANGETRYTRALRVHLDNDGTLVDERGSRVLGDGGPVRVDDSGKKLQVEVDGTLKSGDVESGRIRVVAFVDPQKLDDAEGGYWHAADNLELANAETTKVHQGMRENSNTNALDELVALITVQRQYEAAQRALSTESELRQKLNDGLR